MSLKTETQAEAEARLDAAELEAFPKSLTKGKPKKKRRPAPNPLTGLYYVIADAVARVMPDPDLKDAGKYKRIPSR